MSIVSGAVLLKIYRTQKAFKLANCPQGPTNFLQRNLVEYYEKALLCYENELWC